MCSSFGKCLDDSTSNASGSTCNNNNFWCMLESCRIHVFFLRLIRSSYSQRAILNQLDSVSCCVCLLEFEPHARTRKIGTEFSMNGSLNSVEEHLLNAYMIVKV